MSILLSDADIQKVASATSKVVSDAVTQVATQLVPAIATALQSSLKGTNVTVTVGPITIEPIVVKAEL